MWRKPCTAPVRGAPALRDCFPPCGADECPLNKARSVALLAWARSSTGSPEVMAPPLSIPLNTITQGNMRLCAKLSAMGKARLGEG